MKYTYTFYDRIDGDLYKLRLEEVERVKLPEAKKRVAMSTRKGTNILLDDLLDTAFGSAIIDSLSSTDEHTKRAVCLMVGKIMRKIKEARLNGVDSVVYKISEGWDVPSIS